MEGNIFEQIAQELVKQKHLMDQLEAENRELRQRLADLRAGRGIFKRQPIPSGSFGQGQVTPACFPVCKKL